MLRPVIPLAVSSNVCHVLEDFYREARRRLGVLVDCDQPVGGTWNYDHENREPPPQVSRLPVPAPWWPQEDEIDEHVRADLDRWARDGDVAFVSADGPRWCAATVTEAQHALESFIAERLPTWHIYWHFGPTYRSSNALDAHQAVPDWLWELDAEQVTALPAEGPRAGPHRAWVHHIPRLMLLGKWAL